MVLQVVRRGFQDMKQNAIPSLLSKPMSPLRLKLSSAETCDGSRDALFPPVFVMQTAQDVLCSDLTVTWQCMPLHF